MANQTQVRDAKLIVAIDFGTSYSGYAFQFDDDIKKGPGWIDSPQAWNSGRTNYSSTKTPTCLLLKKGRETDECAFGFKAEETYLEYCLKKTNHEYYFFRRFKMQLQDGQAGIASDKLEIALEPEAASCFCQHVPIGTWSRRDQLPEFAAPPTGTKYMIVDLGGGTADMTVHEKLEDGRLKELSKASGGPWGGTKVDSAFLQLLISIVGCPVMKSFKTDNTFDYLELFNEFEGAKRDFDQTHDMIIKLPPTLDKKCVENSKDGFMKCLEESVHSEEISLVEGKLVITAKLVEKLFRQATDQIVDHMKCILEKGPVTGISHILMVGGFSESPFVKNVVRGTFDGKNGIKVIIPRDAGITIVKGAVLYGIHPQIIESRVLRFTYGSKVAPTFIEGTHPEEKKFNSDTGLRCHDVFDIILSADSQVKNGFSVEKSYDPVNNCQEDIEFDVYYTKEKNPRFTTDPGCTLLGVLNFKFPNPSKDKDTVDVTFQFGMTELKLSARERSRNISCTTKLNMIE